MPLFMFVCCLCAFRSCLVLTSFLTHSLPSQSASNQPQWIANCDCTQRISTSSASPSLVNCEFTIQVSRSGSPWSSDSENSNSELGSAALVAIQADSGTGLSISTSLYLCVLIEHSLPVNHFVYLGQLTTPSPFQHRPNIGPTLSSRRTASLNTQCSFGTLTSSFLL